MWPHPFGLFRKMLLLALLSVQIKADCSASPAEFKYEIRGNSSQELRTEMNSKGPTFNNEKFDAVALWTVYYTWEPKQVSFYGRIEMPAFDTTCALAKTAFQKYYNNLYKHELQHIQHGRTLCLEMEQVLTTATTKAQADAQYADLLAKAIDKDRQYDLITGHGDTEGVCFNMICPNGNTIFSEADTAFKQCLNPSTSRPVATTLIPTTSTTLIPSTATTTTLSTTDEPSGVIPQTPSTNSELRPTGLFFILLTLISIKL